MADDEKKGHAKTGAQKPVTEAQDGPKGTPIREEIAKGQDGPQIRRDAQAAVATRDAQALAAGNPDLRRAEAKAAEQRQRIAELKAKKNAK